MKPRFIFAVFALVLAAAGSAALSHYLPGGHSGMAPVQTEFFVDRPLRQARFETPTAPFTESEGAPAAKHGAKPHPITGPQLQVRHDPPQPRPAEPVRITAICPAEIGANPLLLEYQVVDPGKYIARKDAAFEKGWVSVPLTEQNAAGPNQGEHVYSAELPPSLQKHRRLVRYRIRNKSEQKLIAPDPNDPQPNFAYFVYGGVPAWRGAVDPDAVERKVREAVTYSSEALQRVPVYHLIGSKSAVENATFGSSDGFGDGDRNAYRYTGTLVYDGVVYDHIGFRARGGGWRHAMGKNMWKFNFLPGHRFEARDAYGRRYETKWDKLNLGACIQQGDYGMRGEQGMFEAVGFRLFNLAGTEAPRTHWVHYRIIDESEENPSDQYGGDFWGLYLAVENVDGHFLKEHKLPAGNLYKIEFQPKTAFNGDPAIPDKRDVIDFLSGSNGRRQPDAWWSAQLDLGRYYDYRSIIECIHHYDVDASKNYFYYRNPENRKWAVVPWDLDLTWGDQMYGQGQEPFYRAGLLSHSPFKQQYQERLAEIRDLLYNPEETSKLIDEYAALISDPTGKPSIVDADRAKWDYNPVLESRRVMSMKAGQGKFYFGDPKNTFKVMVAYMKSYVVKRCNWIDRKLLADYRPPAAPRIVAPAGQDFSKASVNFKIDSALPPSIQGYRWRLAEITDPASSSLNPRQPWKYEVESIWDQQSKDAAEVSIPTKDLRAGHVYRVRARWQDSAGAWSRWSAPVQFAVK